MENLTKVGETINAKEVMTSLQIAEITGKQHYHVIRDIDSLIEQGLDASNFGLTSYTDKSNRNQRCYELTKKGCLILASGYDALLRERIINRWEELETKNRISLPTTYKEALQQLLVQVEENEKLQLENKAMLPKAEFFDAVADSKTAIPMNDVAKVLDVKGYGRNNLFEFLRNKKILMQNNRPFQSFIDRGYFRVIEQRYQKNNEECINFKTLVYQKGVDFIRKTINDNKNKYHE